MRQAKLVSVPNLILEFKIPLKLIVLLLLKLDFLGWKPLHVSETLNKVSGLQIKESHSLTESFNHCCLFLKETLFHIIYMWPITTLLWACVGDCIWNEQFSTANEIWPSFWRAFSPAQRSWFLAQNRINFFFSTKLIQTQDSPIKCEIACSVNLIQIFQF